MSHIVDHQLNDINWTFNGKVNEEILFHNLQNNSYQLSHFRSEKYEFS